MSYLNYGENKYDSNSRRLLDDNKNIKRKTIDEQDEPYAMNELSGIDRNEHKWCNKNEDPLLLNAKVDYAPSDDIGASNVSNENKCIHKNTVLPSIANTQQCQSCGISDDKIVKVVESPLSERQKKQLTLLNRKNPTAYRRPKILQRKELHKDQHEDKKNSDEEHKCIRNEISQQNESMEGYKNETRIKRNDSKNLSEHFEEVLLTANKDEYHNSYHAKETSPPVRRKQHFPIEIHSSKVNIDIQNNSTDKINYTSDVFKECRKEQYQNTSSRNNIWDSIRVTSPEYETSPVDDVETNIKNRRKQQNSFLNTSEIEKNIRINKKENTKSEGLNFFTDTAHATGRSGFHSSSSIFDKTEKNGINMSRLNFSGSDKNDMDSTNHFAEEFTSTNQLKNIRSTSPNTTNNDENVLYIVPKDNYVMREKYIILKKKEEKIAEDTGKDSGIMDFSQGGPTKKKIEINLDSDIQKKDLTKFIYRDNYEAVPVNQKNINRNERAPNTINETEIMPDNLKEGNNVEILTKINKNNVANTMDTTKMSNNYLNYDDIPCRGRDISSSASLLSSDFYTTYGNEPLKIKADVPTKNEISVISTKRRDYSMNTSSYLLDNNEDWNNSNMHSSNKIRTSNITNTDNINSNKYNRFGNKRNQHSEQKYTTVSVDKTTIPKGNVNKSTPGTKKPHSSNINKKGMTATVTSKIKTDNVSYITFDELTNFSQVMNAERINEMMNDIIEKSKNNDWTKQIDDLINLRRIMKYYTKIFFDELSKDLRKVVRAVVELINSPRSCVSKNALLCLIEFYNAGKKKTDCTIEDALLPCLKKAHQTSVDFISNAANNALLAICNACSENKLILYLIKQITSKQKTYNLLCLRCLIAVLIKFDHNVMKFKEADKLVEAILGCTVVGSAEIKCTARVALVVLENTCPIRKLCSKNISAADMDKIDIIIDKTSENEIDVVLGKIAVC